LGSVLALDVDERGSGADAQVVEAREQVVAQVAWLPEHNDPMVVDPWYWQGIVAYEHVPEVPGVNDVIPMEVDVGEPILDVIMAEPDDAVATQVGAPLEEHNVAVACEDVQMAEPLPGGDEDVIMTEVEVPGEPMDVDIQQHMEPQDHPDRGVDPDVQMAEAVGAETPSSGGDLPVMAESREEGVEEGAVLNRGADSVPATDLPAPRSEEGRRPIRKVTLVLNKAKAVLNKVTASAPLPAGPSDEFLVKNRKVLIPARGRNKGSSAGRSQDAGPSNSKGKHRVGCTCASCAEEAEDLEEQQAILASFDKSEEEESDDDANVPESSTAAMRRTDRRSRRSGPKAE
jgi:hypothetical protein